jgi:tRNA dimethylallyltransferase
VNNLVVVVGPTSVGKSRLVLRLAQDYDGEIVNADSRQVYQCMDIGTDKPTPEDIAAVPHHLLNIIRPDDDFSLAVYQRLAYEAIDDVQRRSKLPVLTGGSGQYVWAVLEGWQIPAVAPDDDYRRELEEKGRHEPVALYDELVRVDPQAAQRIDGRNVRRVIRALEVNRQTGRPSTGLNPKEPPSYRTLIIGLTMERKALYRLIDVRVDRMLESGLIDEVRHLRAQGFGPKLPAMSSIGYRQIGQYLDGEMGYDEAVRRIKTETHRFVRKQYNWFRLNNERINWFNTTSTDSYPEIKLKLSEFLEGE